MSPVYLREILSYKNSMYSFRYDSLVNVPRKCTSSFCFEAGDVWNSLPYDRHSQMLKGVQEANLHMEPLFMQMFNVQNLIRFILPSSISVTLVCFNLLCFASLFGKCERFISADRQAGRLLVSCILMNEQMKGGTDGQHAGWPIDRWADRHMDGQADGREGGQAGRQIELLVSWRTDRWGEGQMANMPADQWPIDRWADRQTDGRASVWAGRRIRQCANLLVSVPFPKWILVPDLDRFKQIVHTNRARQKPKSF